VRIVRKSCIEGAREATGLTIIIDVFRAFSCEPLLFHLGVTRIILETDTDAALRLKNENTGFILVGEENEIPVSGADLGNSPSHILKRGQGYFHGKTVVHRTTAGVAGVAAACGRADEVILGSFMTARAIARYILEKDPKTVTLVAMGDRGTRPAPEDEACADYLEYLLRAGTFDFIAAVKEIVFQRTAQKFIQGKKAYLPPEDPIFCLQRDVFEFVLKAKLHQGRIEVVKIEVP
jgi:2-phosphosulfolactate phosphatase